jgi:hypothetical protein
MMQLEDTKAVRISSDSAMGYRRMSARTTDPWAAVFAAMVLIPTVFNAIMLTLTASRPVGQRLCVALRICTARKRCPGRRR